MTNTWLFFQYKFKETKRFYNWYILWQNKYHEDSNEFLKYFVDELCEIINTGIIYYNVKIVILLNTIICDTPAKSYILNIKGHTGKHSCLRCKTVGKWSNENNSVYFPDITSSFRNLDEFVSYIDSNFHCGKTILTRIPKFDLVNSIPFDFMHCSCIGIMKNILRFWTRSVKRHQLRQYFFILVWLFFMKLLVKKAMITLWSFV